MNAYINPLISLFDEASYRLLGWHRFDKWERLDVELHTTKDLSWLFANWAWLLLALHLIQNGWLA